jgi:hypothetical protein
MVSTVGQSASPLIAVFSPSMGNRITESQRATQAGTCQACAARAYVDISTDAGVSFKTPTTVNPAIAYAAVSAHEAEHVANEQARAEQQHRRVVAQNVVLVTGICPECGRAYIAGGSTRTITAPEASREKVSAAFDAYA